MKNELTYLYIMKSEQSLGFGHRSSYDALRSPIFFHPEIENAVYFKNPYGEKEYFCIGINETVKQRLDLGEKIDIVASKQLPRQIQLEGIKLDPKISFSYLNLPAIAVTSYLPNRIV